MWFRLTLWLFEIALTALVCFADDPGKAKACSPALPKGYKIDLAPPGCGNRRFQEYSEHGAEPYAGKERIRYTVVGGLDAEPNSWPWMVALLRKPFTIDYKMFVCGASLISGHYVLTAAHCFDKEEGIINPSHYIVTLGAYIKREGNEYPVKKVVIHHDFVKGQVYNDIAVLQLAIQVRFTLGVFPVCLPSDGLETNKIITKWPHKSNVIVTGWGDISYGGLPSEVLQEVNLTLVPLKECKADYETFKSKKIPMGITNNLICAGVSAGGKDACTGDSGGPMVMKVQDDVWVQLGIVTEGYGCGDKGYPGIYTSVASHTRWLADNTNLE